MREFSVGIDFGTTNTVIGITKPEGGVKAVKFSHKDIVYDVYRSVLCFEKVMEDRGFSVEASGGPWAIEKYFQSPNEIRFIQSFKSHVASKLFEKTQVFSENLEFSDILAEFLRRLRTNAEEQLSDLGSSVVSGRPIAFVGRDPDEALAMSRYDAAYGMAGFPKVHYVYEPVGAAYYYAHRIKKHATILVADFGGGTSDFSILHFKREGDTLVSTPIGYAGIGIAGDVFDYRIIDKVISPHLGKGSLYRSFGKLLEVPVHYYANFAKWHYVALLKSTSTLRELHKLKQASLEPKLLEDFIEMIRNDWGFDIYKAVSQTKIELSSQSSATFFLNKGDIHIEETVSRSDFESWIADDVENISNTVDTLLTRHGVSPASIDHVFLTGGSSYIPAVRKIFAKRFGEDKLADGEQFESVAYGLALIGLSEDLPAWTVDHSTA